MILVIPPSTNQLRVRLSVTTAIQMQIPLSYMGVTINPAGPATPIGAPVVTAQGGTVQFYANGTYLYTPPAGYVGPDRLPYTICDVTVVTPQPLCADATIHLLVGPGINIAGKVWDDANGNVIDDRCR